MKRLIIIFLFVFIGKPSFSQSQNWSWAKQAIGGGNYSEGNSACADASGNVFVAGYFQNGSITFGSTTLTNSGPNDDLFIAKYDSAGNVIWAKSVGGSGFDRSYSVSTDTLGNAYLVGSFSSSVIIFGSTTLTNIDPSGNTLDIFIAKYDPVGNLIWARSAGGINNDEGYSISVGNGNVFITGYFASPSITFGSTTLNNSGVRDIFTAKYDANGNLVWANRAGGTAYDQGKGISVDFSGNVIVTGYFYSPSITFGSNTFTNSGTDAVFAVKYDSNGNILWSISAGGASYNEGYSVDVDGLGNVLLTGMFRSTITFGSTTLISAGGNSVFIVKYDSGGNVLWAKNSEGTGGEEGYCINTDQTGNIYVTGSFSSPNITFGSTTFSLSSYSPEPMFIVKYDSNGNLLCGTALGAGGDDQSSVSADAYGNAYVVGDFAPNTFTVGSTTLTLSTTEDFFVAKFKSNCILESVNESNAIENISIYPNPSTGIFSINCTEVIEMIIVNDPLGNKIYKNTSDQKNIDISSFPQGIYFITVKTAIGIAVMKLSKIN